MSLVVNPYSYFTDTNGNALNGYLYVGEVGKNAENYPIAIFYDALFTTPAPNPLTISAGYIYNSGTIAQIYASVDYSIVVKKTDGSLVYSSLNETGMTNGAIANVDEMKNFVAPYDNYVLNVLGYSEAGDGGGGLFYYDANSTEADNGGTIIEPTSGSGRWIRVCDFVKLEYFGVESPDYVLDSNWTWDSTVDKSTANLGTIIDPSVGLDEQGTGSGFGCMVRQYSGAVNVKWFGAKGNNSQTLYPTSYDTDFNDSITITSQTLDAISLNNALEYIKSVGGGALYFPIGIYRISGYLRKIDFPIYIMGESRDGTIIKACDATPTNTHGMGILVVSAEVNTEFKITNITLDGNANVRIEPTGEFRSYNLAIYGNPKGTIDNIKSINSPIDCLYTGYTSTEYNSLNVYNSQFIDSFRNTVSLVSGNNQYWHGCLVSGGGFIHNGTNPRYCLDIEPNSSLNPIENLKFNSCTFENAVNVLIGGIWTESNFSQCTLNAEGNSVVGYPWGFSFGQSKVTLDNCLINGKIGESKTLCESYHIDTPGAFQHTQYLSITGCKFNGSGIHAIGKKTSICNTDFVNSGYPVLCGSADTGRKHELFINNVNLINVVDLVNAGEGAFSSFAVRSDVEGKVIIDGLNIMIDANSFPTELILAGIKYGIYLNSTGALNSEFIIKNVHVSGYYKKLPLILSVSEDANSYRDWGVPNTAPADTVGQITTPGILFYRSCTMLGNN